MPQAPSPRSATSTPLRRAEYYALLTLLATAPRSARLVRAGLRLAGTMQLDGPHRPIQFRPAAEAGALDPLPVAGEAADLLFRIHGISFRCDATVERTADRGDSVYLLPAVIEWSVRGFRVGGVSYSMEPSEAHLRRPDGRAARLPVLSIHDDEVLLLGWPMPQGIEPGMTCSASLLLGRYRAQGIQVELKAAQAVFPGSAGRIVRAGVGAGSAQLGKIVMTLVQAPERRTEPV
jgi:hypothetical protein